MFIPEQIEPVVFEVWFLTLFMTLIWIVVNGVFFKAIESVLKDKNFNDKLVQGWVDEICGKVTKELVETNKPFIRVTAQEAGWKKQDRFRMKQEG